MHTGRNLCIIFIEGVYWQIIKENMEVWGYKNYARGLVEELRKNYHRISDNPDDGWMYTVWLPNDKK